MLTRFIKIIFEIQLKTVLTSQQTISSFMWCPVWHHIKMTFDNAREVEQRHDGET